MPLAQNIVCVNYDKNLCAADQVFNQFSVGCSGHQPGLLLPLLQSCSVFTNLPRKWKFTNVVYACSAVALMDAAEEHLVAAKGAFINISSVVSEIPLPMAAGYCAAKAAQDALTKSWALKYASKGVRVNAVQPGPIDTAAIPTVAEKWGVPVDAFKASNAAATAVGRLGAPEHVGAAIAFLASDLAQYITGVILPVDGGAKLGFWANAQHKIAA